MKPTGTDFNKTSFKEIKPQDTFNNLQISNEQSPEGRVDNALTFLETLPVNIWNRVLTFSEKKVYLTMRQVSTKLHGESFCPQGLKNFFGISLDAFNLIIEKQKTIDKIQFANNLNFTDNTLTMNDGGLREFCTCTLKGGDELNEFKNLQFTRLDLFHLTVDSSTIADILCVLNFLKKNQKTPLVTTLQLSKGTSLTSKYVNNKNIKQIKNLLNHLNENQKTFQAMTALGVGSIDSHNIEQINQVLNSVNKNQIKDLKIGELTGAELDLSGFNDLNCLQFKCISPQADLKLKENTKVKNLIIGDAYDNIDKIKATVLDYVEPLRVEKLGFTQIHGNIDLTPFENLEYLELGEISVFTTITINGFLKNLTTLQVQASDPLNMPGIKPLLEKIAQCSKISKLIFGTGFFNIGNQKIDLDALSVFKDLITLKITAKECVYNEYPFSLSMLEELEWHRIACKIDLSKMTNLKKAEVEIVESGAHIVFPKNLEEVHLGLVKKGAYIDLSLCINLKKVTCSCSIIKSDISIVLVEKGGSMSLLSGVMTHIKPGAIKLPSSFLSNEEKSTSTNIEPGAVKQEEKHLGLVEKKVPYQIPPLSYGAKLTCWNLCLKHFNTILCILCMILFIECWVFYRMSRTS